MNTQTTTQPLIKAVKRVAWGTIIFLVALNVIDLLVSLGIVIIQGNSNLLENLKNVSTTNGWAYIIAGVISVFLVLIRTNQTERQQIFTTRKTAISWQPIIGIILILFIFQLGAELFGTLVEVGLKPLGFSALAEMQHASQAGIRSISMMIYSGVCAPLFEEIVFRGFVFRNLQPFGIKFALIISSLLFACAHGNLIQSPFAFATGMLLGLIAYRYGLKWAIFTHIINNLGLSIGLQLLSQKIAWIPFLTVGLAVIGLVGFILVGMRPFINWWHRNQIPDCFLKITLRQLPILIILTYGIVLALGGIQHQ